MQEDEPPEITYCVVDNAGALTLQTMTPTQPIPPEEELNVVFAEFLVSSIRWVKISFLKSLIRVRTPYAIVF